MRPLRSAERILVCLLAIGGWTSASANAAPAGASAGAQSLRGRLHLHRSPLGVGPSATLPRWACPEGACEAIIAPRPVSTEGGFTEPDSHRLLEGGGELGGFDPADLRSAYKIPASGGSGQTIALIDAYGYPDAESDLAAYRATYGLSACTTKNGCFEKVNEKGERGNYPPEEEDWDGEAALDEDMASAGCPECRILLVEGSTELPADLGESVNTAARLGATEISNSYGYPELLEEYCGTDGCSQYDKDYEHPGATIFAAAGDAGFEDTYFLIGLQTDFPASSPGVTAVGGTALYKDPSSSRGWRESVWNEPELLVGTGSGCSRFEPKPAWQTLKGCSKRTDNDVAAVAAVETGVSVRLDGEWYVFGGTSVASPLLAGIEAHASAFERSLGAQAFYEDPSSLFDVTEGYNWDPAHGKSECAPNEYLCNAEQGYDGPTGLGTPDGVPATIEPPAVTKVKPKSGPAAGATAVTIDGSNFLGVTAVKFGATEAKQFTVNSATSIAAESPAGTPGVVDVTVTTPGGTSPITTKDHFRYKKPKKPKK